MSLVIKGG